VEEHVKAKVENIKRSLNIISKELGRIEGELEVLEKLNYG